MFDQRLLAPTVTGLVRRRPIMLLISTLSRLFLYIDAEQSGLADRGYGGLTIVSAEEEMSHAEKKTEKPPRHNSVASMSDSRERTGSFVVKVLNFPKPNIQPWQQHSTEAVGNGLTQP